MIPAPDSDGLTAPVIDFTRTAESVEEVRRLVEEAGVTSQPPRPDWGDWFSYLGGRALEALAELIGGSVDNVALFARILAATLLAAVIALITMALLQALRRRRTDPVRASVDRIEAVEPDTSTAEQLAAPIEQLLDRGDIPASLRAIWLALASRLGQPSSGGASWTGRRLVRQTGRTDLLPLVRDLELATYGRDGTTLETVRRLWERTSVVAGRSDRRRRTDGGGS